MQLHDAFGKSRNRVTRVAESHTTCAVAVEEFVEPGPFLQLLCLTGDIAKVFVFFQECIEVVEPIGIEETKPGKMSGHAQLFGSCCQ